MYRSIHNNALKYLLLKLQELRAGGKLNEGVEKKIIKIMQEAIEAKKQYEVLKK